MKNTGDLSVSGILQNQTRPVLQLRTVSAHSGAVLFVVRDRSLDEQAAILGIHIPHLLWQVVDGFLAQCDELRAFLPFPIDVDNLAPWVLRHILRCSAGQVQRIPILAGLDRNRVAVLVENFQILVLVPLFLLVIVMFNHDVFAVVRVVSVV